MKELKYKIGQEVYGYNTFNYGLKKSKITRIVITENSVEYYCGSSESFSEDDITQDLEKLRIQLENEAKDFYDMTMERIKNSIEKLV